MKNIAVFFGGVSIESEVSVITGVLTSNSIDKLKFNVIPIFIDNKGEWFTGEYLLVPDNYKSFDYRKVSKVTLISGDNALYLVKGKRIKEYAKISVAINCLHGERGEDGSLAGMLKLCDIPLLSSPMLSSSISMDKRATKIMLKGLSVKALAYFTVDSVEKLNSIKPKFSYPMIVKPNCGGSSIGIKTANNKKELIEAVRYALKFGDSVIVEPCLNDFTEINCAVYSVGEKVMASPCEKPMGKDKVLTFSDKYENGKREFPAKISQEISLKIQETAKKIYSSLCFSGIIRIDFFISNGVILVNEINSVPGSMGYYLFCDTLKQFTELLTSLIEDTLVKSAKQGGVQKSFKSGILYSVGSKSSKCL